MSFNTIEEAIQDIKQGKVVIVIDDENRENEGDFVAAAEMATAEMINFMATHGKGLICTPLLESRCKELGLELMIGKNTAAYETPFTISVDLIGHGCTTGISASDRAKTIKALVDPNINPDELGRPGHIFPLKAREGGVLRRAGHTEATIDLARLAGFQSAGVIVEILNKDGSMARTPQLHNIAEKFNFKIKIVPNNPGIIRLMNHNAKLDAKISSFSLVENAPIKNNAAFPLIPISRRMNDGITS